METRPSLIPDMVANGGDTPKMIIKLYGEQAKQFAKEHNLPRNISVRASNLPAYRLTNIEGRDIVEVILE